MSNPSLPWRNLRPRPVVLSIEENDLHLAVSSFLESREKQDQPSADSATGGRALDAALVSKGSKRSLIELIYSSWSPQIRYYCVIFHLSNLPALSTSV